MTPKHAAGFSKYSSAEQARILLSRQMAAEGMVLLENDGILPLAAGNRVALFGSAQYHFLTGGSGSGASKSNYTVTVAEAFDEAGIITEPALRAKYEAFCSAQSAVSEETRAHNVFRKSGTEPEMPLDADDIEAASREADTAVYILSRMAGEGEDRKPVPGDYYLTDTELDILNSIRRAFPKMIVVLNVAGIVDLQWMDSCTPSALILAWLPGQEGACALADIIVGNCSPSGHLADTIAYRLEDHPSTVNFGGFIDGLESYTGTGDQIEYWGMIGNHSAVPAGQTVQRPINDRWFVEYQEGLYVGYRYFTTFGVPVRYPFGYGLSYTTFDITPGPAVLNDGSVNLGVTVKNTGDRCGKQVVQIYCRCAGGQLERPERELAAFQKTPLLQPSESCSLHFDIPIRQLSAYSEALSAWVLEAGKYCFYAGSNCAELISAGSITLPYSVTERVQNHFALNHTRALNQLSRLDHAGTAPKAPPMRLDGGEVMNKPQPRLHFTKPVLPDAAYRLSDVYNGKTSLDEFVSQMDNMELVFLCVGAGMFDPMLDVFGKADPDVEDAGGQTSAIDRLGIPTMVMSDGPAGIAAATKSNRIAFTTACVSSCSWNVELAERLGEAIGAEALENSVDVWLAPAMNIHRNPLCGRNYEYFSEDPYLSGKIAAAIIRGAQRTGVICCPKHFAVNNQETDRFDGIDSVVSERVIREIYLKGFEIVVKKSAPGCIMTSYNSLNGTYTAACRELITDVLRGEWGFDGFVVTDWEGDGPYSLEALRAGNDLLMPGFDGQNQYLMDKIDSGKLTRRTLLACAKNILRGVMRSNNFKKRLQNS